MIDTTASTTIINPQRRAMHKVAFDAEVMLAITVGRLTQALYLEIAGMEAESESLRKLAERDLPNLNMALELKSRDEIMTLFDARGISDQFFATPAGEWCNGVQFYTGDDLSTKTIRAIRFEFEKRGYAVQGINAVYMGSGKGHAMSVWSQWQGRN